MEEAEESDSLVYIDIQWRMAVEDDKRGCHFDTGIDLSTPRFSNNGNRPYGGIILVTTPAGIRRVHVA